MLYVRFIFISSGMWIVFVAKEVKWMSREGLELDYLKKYFTSAYQVGTQAVKSIIQNTMCCTGLQCHQSLLHRLASSCTLDTGRNFLLAIATSSSESSYR